jgi:voltage-gated potassium channel
MKYPEIINSRMERLRIKLEGVSKRLREPVWFPHVPLALMLWLAGFWVLQGDWGNHWFAGLRSLANGDFYFNLQMHKLPSLFIGSGMLIMGFALLWRSRLAWIVALLLAVTATTNTVLGRHAHAGPLSTYFLLIVVALLVTWRSFDRSSVAASTLFAVTSGLMLLLYATFGAYYLGAGFTPPINNLVTALYYSMVTMSTVGYGDIVPRTDEARLFTVSVIILGVAVFATSLTAVIAPLVSRSLLRIVNRRSPQMKRHHHYVVVGNTSLAINTAQELEKRGLVVVRILREAVDAAEAKGSKVVLGDPSTAETLRQADAEQATAVLAMLDDDAENAFVTLAMRELAPGVRIVAAVNDARQLNKVKLAQPDVVIAPQVLGGELTAMLLAGETITSDFVMQHVFQNLKTGTSTGD